MKHMKSKSNNQRFSVDELIRGTGLKKSQIDYEIRLMMNASIVEKVADMKDLRRTYYVKGVNFDAEWEQF